MRPECVGGGGDCVELRNEVRATGEYDCCRPLLLEGVLHAAQNLP